MYFILTEVYLYVSQYTCNIRFMQKTVTSKLTFETWIQNKGNAKRGVSPRIKIWPYAKHGNREKQENDHKSLLSPRQRSCEGI
jgi:hypothetical protein